MGRFNIYCFLLLLFCSYTARAQYLCDYEYKVMNKQKKLIKKKCKKTVTVWLAQNSDSLNLPKKLKLSKLKYRSKNHETNKNIRYNKWHEIDSLLCVKKDPKYVRIAKKRLLELQLVVYDIRAEFHFQINSNKKIESVLNFEFDIDGNLLRAIIREKKMSPFSETPH